MKRDGHENTVFFVGPEVEHTPAYSRKTLFVVGKQKLNLIVDLAREHKVTHIFMGANHSFDVDPTDGTLYWDQTITALLDRGFWVSLDYPAHQHQHVLKMLSAGVWQSRMFVPLLSVRVPNIQTSSPNLTVKIDDIDFKATNPGVWCLHYHEVTDSNRFTDWIEYGSDVVITEDVQVEEKAVPAQAAAPMPNVGRLQDTESAFMGSLAHLADKEEREKAAADAKNDEAAGLDPTPTTALKDDPNWVPGELLAKLTPTSPKEAAEAYAGDAKVDPLSAEGSKKPTKAKK